MSNESNTIKKNYCRFCKSICENYRECSTKTTEPNKNIMSKEIEKEEFNDERGHPFYIYESIDIHLN